MSGVWAAWVSDMCPVAGVGPLSPGQFHLSLQHWLCQPPPVCSVGGFQPMGRELPHSVPLVAVRDLLGGPLHWGARWGVGNRARVSASRLDGTT